MYFSAIKLSALVLDVVKELRSNGKKPNGSLRRGIVHDKSHTHLNQVVHALEPNGVGIGSPSLFEGKLMILIVVCIHFRLANDVHSCSDPAFRA